MKTLTLNGVAVAAPISIEIGFQDLDAETSGRNVLGRMMRDRIASDKRKASIKWGPLDDAQISAILQAIKPVFFTASVPDPELGQRVMEVYTGDKTAALLDYSIGKWKDLTFTLIER